MDRYFSDSRNNPDMGFEFFHQAFNITRFIRPVFKNQYLWIISHKEPAKKREEQNLCPKPQSIAAFVVIIHPVADNHQRHAELIIQVTLSGTNSFCAA